MFVLLIDGCSVGGGLAVCSLRSMHRTSRRVAGLPQPVPRRAAAAAAAGPAATSPSAAAAATGRSASFFGRDRHLQRRSVPSW